MANQFVTIPVMKKKQQKRIIGRASKTHRLREKREPNVGPALFDHWHRAVAAMVAMYDYLGPLGKGPYRKPLCSKMNRRAEKGR